MRGYEISLDCECCDLWIVPGKPGRPSLYRYNDEDYLGRVALAAAVGMSAGQIDRRMATKTCLRMSTQAMKALHESAPKGKTGGRSDLVYAFCRNMAASFGRLEGAVGGSRSR